jgi:4-amino-4-deoxy-L-arabinose transferase-like glycosyltransferase
MVSYPARSRARSRNPTLKSLISLSAFACCIRPGALIAVGSTIALAGVLLRLHFASFLDPFEDGYQNWWISANLLETGQYWDRHSMMTQGNWLPLYHVYGTAVLAVGGWHNMEALKGANIVLSVLIMLLVFGMTRKDGISVAFAASAFLALNFIDVIVSGWATAESLATFLILLGYASLFEFGGSGNRWRAVAAASFGLAVLTRYEAWLVVGLLVGFALFRGSRQERNRILLAALPAAVCMTGYFVYALQWGFLPDLVTTQTSTDVRFQLGAGTQPSPANLLGRWWLGLLGMLPILLPVGGAYALWTIRRDFGGWILVALWGFIVVYTVLQYGNPSYRYVMISVPFLAIYTARGLQSLIGRLPRARRRPASPREAEQVRFVVLTLAVVAVGATLLPNSIAFWSDGFPASDFMVPLERAGAFVASLPRDPDRILVTESPIAGYYSGYAANRMLGSRWLPDGREEAISFLRANAQYIVYMGVPYYRLRTLFPELQNGTDTPEFRFLYDAGGAAIGTHAVLVYQIVP